MSIDSVMVLQLGNSFSLLVNQSQKRYSPEIIPAIVQRENNLLELNELTSGV